MKYIIKRFFESLVTIFIIISLVFLLMRLLPADKYFSEDELRILTNDQIHAILEQNGFLDPPLVQLMRYYQQVFIKHDLGVSRRIKMGVPVVEIIGARFGNSMRFGIMGLLLSLCIGIPAGVSQARHKDGLIDQIGLGYTIAVNSIPGLVFYTLIMVFGAKVLGLPPLYSVKKPIVSSIMPVICLSLGGIAGRMIWVRRYMVDEFNKDYIKLATAKGLTEKQVLYRHVLRNAFVPLSSGLPGAVLHTIGGSLLVESFFSIPGMGYLLATAIGMYDTNVVQTLVILYGTIGVFGAFLGDLTLMLFDPRVRLGRKEETR